jgi:hypothetical protein
MHCCQRVLTSLSPEGTTDALARRCQLHYCQRVLATPLPEATSYTAAGGKGLHCYQRVLHTQLLKDTGILLPEGARYIIHRRHYCSYTVVRRCLIHQYQGTLDTILPEGISDTMLPVGTGYNISRIYWLMMPEPTGYTVARGHWRQRCQVYRIQYCRKILDTIFPEYIGNNVARGYWVHSFQGLLDTGYSVARM